MSDTSGGQLDSDMPGIGTAPPVTGIARSPLQLPSALQGLAKIFQQQSPQGAQPRPQPPKPVLTEEQARKPPEHTGKPASFAPVPPGAPVQTGNFTPYIKAQDRREPDQWATPVDFPRLPATFELPGIFRQIGQYFAQSGGDVGQAGADLSFHSDHWWESFAKGQDHRMKVEQEGVALAAAKLDQSITNRLIDNQETFAEYNRVAGGDKAKLATVTINGVDLYHALAQNAYQDGNTHAMQMFEAGRPLQEILNFLGDDDKILRDLQAARTKASNQSDHDATYDLQPKEAQKGWGDAVFAPDQTAAAPKTSASTPEIFKGLTPELINHATDMFLGDKSEGLKGEDLHNVVKLSDRMGAELNAIKGDKSIKPGQYVDEVRKRLGDTVADVLKQIEDYTEPALSTGSGYGGKAGAMRRLQDIAAIDLPGEEGTGKGKWSAANFKSRADFNKDNRVLTVLARTNDMANALDQTGVLLDRIHNVLKKRGMKDTQVNLSAIADILGGGDYLTLNAQLNNFAAAYNAIIQYGHITVTGQQIVAEDLTAGYRPLSSVRDIIKTHIPTAQGILHATHNRWDAIGGGPNPNFDAKSEKTIDDWGKVDIKTGVRPGMAVKHQFPDGHVGRAIWTGKNPVNRDADENWIEQ